MSPDRLEDLLMPRLNECVRHFLHLKVKRRWTDEDVQCLSSSTKTNTIPHDIVWKTGGHKPILLVSFLVLRSHDMK